VSGLQAPWLVPHAAQWFAQVSPLSALMALVFFTLVGVFFSYDPVRKAALLKPIDALRQE
jgi:ABC-type antimicrobial peptide transport system permease subunit